MKLTINSKFDIGDLVKLYGEEIFYDEITCPFCNGRYEVMNPNSEYDDNHELDYLTCPYCDKGKFERIKSIEKILSDEIYEVIDVDITFNKNSKPKFKYYIKATPELNNKEIGYMSLWIEEEGIELVKKNNDR